MMVSLRGVQAGCTQQGSALPEQRCHLHPGCVVRVLDFTGSDPPSAGVAMSLALFLLYPDLGVAWTLLYRRQKRGRLAPG